jgi:toxin FitB
LYQRVPLRAGAKQWRWTDTVYLLDTNVVSELRKARPHGAVLQWLSEVGDVDLHLSAVTLGEVQKGIELTRDQNAAKAVEIEAWLELLTVSYNVIPMDSVTFRLWAKLMHRTSDALYEDAMLAATAQVHRLTVVTRNVADFKSFGVEVLDPFRTSRR